MPSVHLLVYDVFCSIANVSGITVRYRLYLDESGDHTTTDPINIGKRYLGLVGVAIQQDEKYRTFSDALDEFRREHFGEDPPVLHREEIINRSGDFAVLRDNVAREKFDDGLLDLFSSTKCWIVAVVVDKHEHGKARYRKLTHPYHYGLHALLERYCGFLKLYNATGDVMAESRGKVEDMALKSAYTNVYHRGTNYLKRDVCQCTLSSREIKIKPKQAGVSGLQLADILAHPLTRDVLVSYKRLNEHGGWYCKKIVEIAAKKYNKQIYNGRINGYGRVFLA